MRTRDGRSSTDWLEEMDKLEFQICLVAGKANSKGKLKKRYRQLLRRGRKAAYIKQGSRNPVIGYKPQRVRSGNGFVTSLLVPEGNAADSIKLVPAIKAVILIMTSTCENGALGDRALP